ncbi:hypothetical protein OU787_08925 [Kitasatospora sp. YST-16]|uniref:hypothetical protein n=1 Tax=Kitasatospora sp. YST-16 TaxID=2998080 RepID=UPI002284B76E|nr:hypothetical protein [Kitasatospora sp. YST-16]WAL71618.1 hypothetical protein OU787_08925 [Kitasatospora sp. YST-16]WNW37656.1 hypothetical protein RKE32_08875 [Streptomyces sp. Li-HN-5-13]
MADQWEPGEGREAYDRRSGQAVRVISVHVCGVFVRHLRDGREDITTLGELAPPENTAGEQ